MPTFCSGCEKTFRDGYYTRHLEQTNNPACQALAHDLHSYLPPDLDSEERKAAPPAIDPTGDYYGNYADMPDQDWNMGNMEDPELQRAGSPDDLLGEEEYEFGLKSDSESEADLLDHDERENGWEPDVDSGNEDDVVRPRSPSLEPLLPDEEDEPEPIPPQLHPGRMALPKEPYVQRYPDPRAGEPISTTHSENDRYRDEVGEASSANVWAPFTSELDWGVARWAKL